MGNPLEDLIAWALERDDARRAENWPRYIELAHGQEGLRALREHGDQLPPETWWRLVGEKYREALELHVTTGFIDLLRDDRPGRDHIMSPADRDTLARMPPELIIWRGGRDNGELQRGWSWTLDRKIARWYAVEYRASYLTGRPCLLRGRCARSGVLAYFSDRNEAEILIDPDQVSDMVEEPV